MAASAEKLEQLSREATHDFQVPVKQIHDGDDLGHFHTSKAYHSIVTFLFQLNGALFPEVKDDSVEKWQTDIFTKFSDSVLKIRELLSHLDKLIDEAPPDTGPRRFGNVSFRTWMRLVEEKSSSLLQESLPAHVRNWSGAGNDGTTAASEIQSYLLNSFGSSQRLDYGTGHELSFLAFLGCLWKLDVFPSGEGGSPEREIVFGIFEPYIRLVRRLILIYNLEPAGSHGVWGLDDHSFLPYIFGSAQLSPPIPSNGSIPTEGSGPDVPDASSVNNITAVERERKRNMYFDAIGFIYDVKKGPFWEHSPMLYDISGVQTGWAKINKGMLKMYNVEVLSKFPVVQHFYFGSLFSWDQDPTTAAVSPSIHQTSQPTRSSGSDSLGSGVAEKRPNESSVTMAPWAKSKATNTTTRPPVPTRFPRPGEVPSSGGPSVPSQAGGLGSTKAPWANAPRGPPGKD